MKIDRRDMLKLCAAAAVAACDQTPLGPPMTKSNRMPVLFVGHGSPMHAIQDNVWSRGFAALGAAIPKPKAVLSVSAHWYDNTNTRLTNNEFPQTIHDFGGFPQALFDIQYPAPGSPSLAARVRTILGEERAQLSGEWGLDHGTWTVLKYMFPNADIPVIQLSIDARMTIEQHVAMGRELQELRDDGVLIFGTGNITHNLRHAMAQMRQGDPSVPAFSKTFDDEIVTTLTQRDAANLKTILGREHGRLSHPSLDHYVPLLYAFGASDDKDAITYPVEGFDIGLSMRSVLWTRVT
ncbi:MAG: 4,5-DOPA dioxygenase extradiol [bacterium]